MNSKEMDPIKYDALPGCTLRVRANKRQYFYEKEFYEAALDHGRTPPNCAVERGTIVLVLSYIWPKGDHHCDVGLYVLCEGRVGWLYSDVHEFDERFVIIDGSVSAG